MKISICIDSIFESIDSIEALATVKAAGFGAFEFWLWHNKDMEAPTAKARELGLDCVAFCTREFNLTDHDKRAGFIQGIKDSIVMAKKHNTPFLITQSGDDTGKERSFQHKSIVAGLKEAAPLLEESGITLLLEPLNDKIDHKGIYLVSSNESFEIIDEVVSPNIKVLFDIYHQQISEGDIIRQMTSNLDKIGHIHCAGNPGRHELDSGELDYARIFKALDSAGYSGYAGMEYFPKEAGTESLKRIKEMTNE